MATALSASPDDRTQLLPMIDAVKENTGDRPELVLADKGYLTEQNLQKLSPEAALPDRRRSGGQEAPEVADGACDATHASPAASAVGPRAVGLPQDAGDLPGDTGST